MKMNSYWGLSFLFVWFKGILLNSEDLFYSKISRLCFFNILGKTDYTNFVVDNKKIKLYTVFVDFGAVIFDYTNLKNLKEKGSSETTAASRKLCVVL